MGYDSPKKYGLRGIRGLWVMGTKSLQTKLGSTKFYGISGVMGYKGHGLGEVQLYVTHARCSLTTYPEWQMLHAETRRAIGRFIFEHILC